MTNLGMFIDTLESIQYNATLSITGAIKETSKEKLCNELGLKYLRDRRWMQRNIPHLLTAGKSIL